MSRPAREQVVGLLAWEPVLGSGRVPWPEGEDVLYRAALNLTVYACLVLGLHGPSDDPSGCAVCRDLSACRLVGWASDWMANAREAGYLAVFDQLLFAEHTDRQAAVASPQAVPAGKAGRVNDHVRRAGG
jgi:hypothetical protein